MHLFYTPDIVHDGFFQLNEEESKHAIRVLRLRLNDEVWLTNGKGDLFQAQVLEDHPKRCKLQIINHIAEYNKRNYHVHMAVAPTKNNARFEWFLEKATEIGIDEITPILCDHSERNNVNIDRFNKVITAALKQSLKAYHPQLNPMQKFSDVLTTNTRGKMLLAYCKASSDDRIETVINPGDDLLIFIGPEGGFSDNEIEKAREQQVSLVSISGSRLRTETAALVACHSIAFINKT